jgi:hypothetical protein
MKSTLMILLWTISAIPVELTLLIHAHNEHPEWNWTVIWSLSVLQFVVVMGLFHRAHRCEQLHKDEKNNDGGTLLRPKSSFDIK